MELNKTTAKSVALLQFIPFVPSSSNVIHLVLMAELVSAVFLVSGTDERYLFQILSPLGS